MFRFRLKNRTVDRSTEPGVYACFHFYTLRWRRDGTISEDGGWRAASPSPSPAQAGHVRLTSIWSEAWVRWSSTRQWAEGKRVKWGKQGESGQRIGMTTDRSATISKIVFNYISGRNLYTYPCRSSFGYTIIFNNSIARLIKFLSIHNHT
jgi:hypothetical protein